MEGVQAVAIIHDCKLSYKSWKREKEFVCQIRDPLAVGLHFLTHAKAQRRQEKQKNVFCQVI